MRIAIMVLGTMAALAAMPAGAQQLMQPAMVAPIDGAVLDVVAEGRTTRVPDVATVRAGVVTQAATAAEALTRNSAQMARVLAALKRAGIADRDIQTATIALNPQYRYGDNQPPVITGYQATNTVSVRFRDIARSGAVLDALVSQGANQIDGPSLSLDQPEAALDEARADAVRKARARAELYAGAAGLHVVRILAISESEAPAMPTPMPMMARRDSASETKIAAGEQAVIATVSVRFLLK